MSIKLEDLDFQQQAIDAVVHVLDGQVRNTFEQANLLGIHRNVVELSPEKLHDNKCKIIKANGISAERSHRLLVALEYIEETQEVRLVTMF